MLTGEYELRGSALTLDTVPSADITTPKILAAIHVFSSSGLFKSNLLAADMFFHSGFVVLSVIFRTFAEGAFIA